MRSLCCLLGCAARRLLLPFSPMSDLDAQLAASASSAAAAAVSSVAIAAPAVAAEAAAGPSLQLHLSHLLGVTVSAGSALVKLPQLLALVRSRSTVGVSLSMYSLELFSQSIAVLYHRAQGFPVATYGENLTLGAGNIAILAAFAAINHDPRAIVSLAFPLLLSPLVRYPSLLALLQSLSIPLNIAAKLPQILINQQLIALLQERARAARKMNKAAAAAAAAAQARQLQTDAGATVAPLAAAAAAAASASAAPLLPPLPQSRLSALPFALNLGGSTSRLFTTYAQLGGDRVMLVGFLVSCILNAAILVQCQRIKMLQKECADWQQQQQQQQQQQTAVQRSG